MNDIPIPLWIRVIGPELGEQVRWGYRTLGISGASSHSGRRTAITLWARRTPTVGGSLRDVQLLAGHSALGTTQRYIEGSDEAKRRVVEMV